MHKTFIAKHHLQVLVLRMGKGLILEQLQPGRKILRLAVERGGAPLVTGEFFPVTQALSQVLGSVAVFADREQRLDRKSVV